MCSGGFEIALQRLHASPDLPPRFVEEARRILEAVAHYGHAPAATLWRFTGLSSRNFYAALWKLTQMGILAGVAVERKVHFGFADPPHDHLVCVSCGRVVDVLCSETPRGLEVEVPGWTVLRSATVAYGVCPDCRRSLNGFSPGAGGP